MIGPLVKVSSVFMFHRLAIIMRRRCFSSSRSRTSVLDQKPPDRFDNRNPGSAFKHWHERRTRVAVRGRRKTDVCREPYDGGDSGRLQDNDRVFPVFWQTISYPPAHVVTLRRVQFEYAVASERIPLTTFLSYSTDKTRSN